MARIVIAGCGDVGIACGLRLQNAGHEVWGLRRNVTVLPAQIKPLAADLTDIDSFAHLLPANIDYLIYAAAAGGYNATRYQAIYVDGVANIVRACEQQSQPLQRIIFTSSTSVYSQTEGEWITEDSPAEASGFAAEALRAGEQLIWDSTYSGTVIRFGGIYGPGRTRLLDMVRSGTAQCIEGLYTNRIHRDDCANVIAHLLRLDHSDALYLGVDDRPVLQCEVMSWLAQQLDVPVPTQQAPERSDQESTSHRIRSNKRCSNARLRASGYEFNYPDYRAGYAALLDNYRHSILHA